MFELRYEARVEGLGQGLPGTYMQDGKDGTCNEGRYGHVTGDPVDLGDLTDLLDQPDQGNQDRGTYTGSSSHLLYTLS